MFGDSFDSYYFGKSPMEDPQLYINKSPFFKMDKVQAPVLIFHGTADTNVPPAQSWSYFRALQYYGKVPVKFVLFPGTTGSVLVFRQAGWSLTLANWTNTVPATDGGTL